MPRTPEETFRLLLDLLLAKDMDAIADLWAPEGTGEFPFAIGTSPRHLAGREEIRGYLSGYPERMDVRAIPAVTVHRTGRPDTIVVEFSVDGRTVRTGEPYRLDYISVITVQDGLITRYRDYWNPLAAAAAAGTLPELLGLPRPEAF
ncbi:nuclear transport factor 2 family protein [Actinomadura terrae]|uniref:nuclear transport factor 2 family protein n=1 Tax=Actinomadura terrae TaxID=604353 RepID=UPI001FA6C9FE|nr:nuclear transport factor 2 family protein [Actinomadura terrae]